MYTKPASIIYSNGRIEEAHIVCCAACDGTGFALFAKPRCAKCLTCGTEFDVPRHEEAT